MKATIEFDDLLYRRLKIEAARRGRTIRELVDEGVRYVLSGGTGPRAKNESGIPKWFGSLARYADVVDEHDMTSVRRSIAARRRKPGE